MEDNDFEGAFLKMKVREKAGRLKRGNFRGASPALSGQLI